ncbi:helix-turn-helix transcriptional regulator [Actinoplanes sp. NPDC023936]|uniref:helix-turn-helix domain-containing protein n=1 Tax=Actinoplanes sp. NPDC023936 TaxID=3154910 RepID=UPI0033EEEA6F
MHDAGSGKPDIEAGETFGAQLRRARKTLGWSQERLEAESGVSRETISRYERDLTGTPEPAQVRALCAATGIDPREAAVSLGYLTLDEIQPVKPLPSKLQEVLDVLQDPRLDPAEAESWIDYLMYLRGKNQSRTDAG